MHHRITDKRNIYTGFDYFIFFSSIFFGCSFSQFSFIWPSISHHLQLSNQCRKTLKIMEDALSRLKKFFKRQEVIVDSSVFRIHSIFTTAFLLGCSVVVTLTQLVGKPIRCVWSSKNTEEVERAVTTYCWIMSTFTVPDLSDAFNRPKGMIANDHGDESNKKYYTYYQWVCFVLFFQALLCYFPKWLWRIWEGGLMKSIVCGLNVGLRSDEETEKSKRLLVNYLLLHSNQHGWYTFRYWFCELLCLANVIFQMFLMNWFLDGDFLLYGWKVLSLDDQDHRADHMHFVFPRLTKCTFRKFGPTGSVEKHDAMCVLPLNVVNEKTYIFLWFWYTVLICLTTLLALFRLFLICFPWLRVRLMLVRNRMLSKQCVEHISNKLSIGDWWLLYMLERNLEPQIYKAVLEQLQSIQLQN